MKTSFPAGSPLPPNDESPASESKQQQLKKDFLKKIVSAARFDAIASFDAILDPQDASFLPLTHMRQTLNFDAI